MRHKVKNKEGRGGEGHTKRNYPAIRNKRKRIKSLKGRRHIPPKANKSGNSRSSMFIQYQRRSEIINKI